MKWGPFFDDTPRVLHYTIMPPGGWSAPIDFSGILSEDGQSSVLPSQSLSLYPLHPADNAVPANNFITIFEMSAYAAAWRRSLYWPVVPSPIPVDGNYVTQAGLIWKNGEYYSYVGGSAPGCWQPAAIPPGVAPASWSGSAASSGGRSVALAGIARSAAAATGVAIRSCAASVNPSAPFDVNILVTPTANTTAYLVEEQLPVGWKAMNITQGGRMDTSLNKVKWGPFFSSSARTLAYTAVPPNSIDGNFTLSGLAAFDGTVLKVAGQEQITLGSGQPPVITAQPQSQTVTVGGNATFSVTVSGSAPLSYQWQKNGASISGATGASLTLNNAQASDAGGYTAVISNFRGSITSLSAVLTVGIVNPLHPADNNPADNHLTLTEVVAYGAAWKRGDTWPTAPNPIPLDYVIRAATLWKGGETYQFDPTVPTAPLWWINSARAGLGPLGAAEGKARRDIGLMSLGNTAVSSIPPVYSPSVSFTVTITVAPISSVIAYGVEEQVPAGWTVANVNQGGAFDPANRKVKWGPYFDNTTRILTYDVTPPTGTAGVLTFVGSVSFDGTNVAITGQRTTSDGGGNASGNANTAVSTLPSEYTAGLAFNVSIAVTPTSTLSAYGVEDQVPVGWTMVNVNQSGAFDAANRKVKWGPFFDNLARTLTYDVTPPTSASGSAIFAGSAAFAEVNLAITGQRVTTARSTPVIVPPTIAVQPQSQTVTVGDSVTFSVTACGTASLSYRWQKNGTLISGATGTTFTLNNTQPSDAASYTVVVSNAGGSATSASATLTVNSIVLAPTISVQPQSQTVTVGDSVTICVTASSTAPLSYQWRKGTANIAGATSACYTIVSVTSASAGNYTVVVSNSFGSVTSTAATLVVNPLVVAPTINIQPQSQTVTVGGSATFSVTASGTAPLSYQWRKAGVNLVNGGRINGAAADTLVIDSVQTTDLGNYTVVVSNPSGGVTSGTAVLTVIPPSVNGVVWRVEDGGNGHSYEIVSFASGISWDAARSQAEAKGGHLATITSQGEEDFIRKAVLPTIHDDPEDSFDSWGWWLGAQRAGGAGTWAWVTGEAFSYTSWSSGQPNEALANHVWLAMFSYDATDWFPGFEFGNWDDVVADNAGLFNGFIVEYEKSSGGNAAPTPPPNPNTVRGDFDGDGNSDLIFQDDAGFLAAWLMKGATSSGVEFLTPSNVGDNNYRIVGSGDFDGDGKEDLLFQHTDGTLAVWYMNGTEQSGAALINPKNPGDHNWRVAAVADLNEDGRTDIVFQHTDGTLAAWFMNGVNLSSATLFNPANPGDQNWKVAGAGDFNADGKVDLVFQHTDGTFAVWLLNGTQLAHASVFSPSNPGDRKWRVVAVDDVNKDGKPDLIFQHADGTLAVWFMNGVQLTSAQLLSPSNPGGTWKVVGPR